MGTAKQNDIKFFKCPADFRKWLERHHLKESELIVGFYKISAGLPSITWPESVDEALCYGWIDGVRRSLDDKSYCIRFTPRRKDSHWSAVNIKKMNALVTAGKVSPAGLEAFSKRREENSAKASYEQGKVRLDPDYERLLRENDAAWEFFNSRPPYYRRQCAWWIMSAKREETQMKRLHILIAHSAAGTLIPPFRKAT